jgi:hypothetical protein
MGRIRAVDVDVDESRIVTGGGPVLPPAPDGRKGVIADGT